MAEPDTLDAWLEEWHREEGWRARKAEVQRLVDEIERLRPLAAVGERVETVTFGEIAQALRVEAGTDVPGYTTDGEWDTFDNFDSDRITRVVMRVLASPDTPPQGPGSPSEAPPAPGQPEDGSGPRGDRPCMACGHSYEAHSFPWPGTHEVCTWRHCTCKGFR